MKENGNSYTANDLSKVKLIKDESKYYKSSDTDTHENEIPSVSFITLFRFASTKDKLYILLAIIFSIICGCTTPINILLFSSFLQSMVNYGKSNANNNPQPDVFLRHVTDFAIYSSLVGAVIVTLSYAATVLMNISAFNQVYRIRQEYLKSALNQDFQYFDTHQTGNFASKMTDHVSKLEDGIGEKLATFIFYQTSFISSIVMAFSKGLLFAVLCLILFPVPLFLLGILCSIASRLSKKEAIALDKAGSLAEEVLSAIQSVNAFSGQHKEIERYEKYLIEARGINIKKGFLNGLAMGTLYFFIFGAYALSFWFGYKLMMDEPEIYDVETMIAVLFGIIMGSYNLGTSLTLMEVFGNARAAGAQIFNLIDNAPTINPLLNIGITPEPIERTIELKNVVFHYPSRPGVAVLKGVSLSVQKGQSVALVGHSGCGKSAIIQLISRHYDAVDGSVHIDGYDVRKVSVKWLREQIGLVDHEPVLFNTTIRDNIKYGREDASDDEIEKVAKQANAHKFIMKLPSGYDTLIGRRGASLSEGQKQRIAIARALVRNPQILLIDEATSALHTSAKAKVQEALDKAQEGRTTIVVAHRLSTIRNVDKIYVFKSGDVVESGNHKELMTKKGYYYDMIKLQACPDKNERELGQKMVSVLREKDEDDIETRIQESAGATESREVSFFQVLQLFLPEWKSITAASICSFVSGFAMPLLAVILGDLIGILSNPYRDVVTAQVLRYSLMIFGVGIFSGITNFVMVSMYGVAAECVTARLRKQLFERMLQQEVGFYDDENNSTRALCDRLSEETMAIQGATGQGIGVVLQAVGTFSFALGVSLYYEARLGSVALLFIPFMAAVLYKEHRMVSAECSGTAKIMEYSSKITVETVANVHKEVALGCKQNLINDYSAQLLPALEVGKRSSHWRGIVFGFSRGLFNFIYAATLYYGGNLMVYHGVGYDIILSSAQIVLMGPSSAAKAFLFAPNFQKGIKAAKRVIIMLGRNSKIIDPRLMMPAVENFKTTGETSFQNVSFKYPTRPLTEVLQNFNLKTEKGKTIAFQEVQQALNVAKAGRPCTMIAHRLSTVPENYRMRCNNVTIQN